MKTKLKIHQVYSINPNRPMPSWLEAFDALVKFPTLEPSTQMQLKRIARQVQEQINDAQQVHQGLLDTYLERDEEGKPVMSDGRPAWKDEPAFYESFNNLLNAEFEISALPASVLDIASRRYWQLFERGHTNGHQPLRLVELEDFVYDDLTPVEEAPPVVENTTKETAVMRRRRKRAS
jgi:hypothetical protein